MDIQNLTATQILRARYPGDLFTGDLTKAKTEYRTLLKLWHPDHNREPQSVEVSKKIVDLYNLAVYQLGIDKWETPGLLEIGTNSHKFRIRYKKHSKFELGDMYIGDTVLAYIVDKENKDLLNNYKNIIEKFKFASDSMKEEFTKYLPQIIRAFEVDDEFGLVLSKTPDLLRLRDVLNYYKGRMEPRVVAWIMSSLHNLTCYLDYAGISHNDISPDTYFVSMKYHSGALLGGWWYSALVGEPMKAVPNRTYQYMPMDVKKSKIASTKTDLELIRSIGRELLGDISGIRLNQIDGIPKPLINWLQLPSPTGSAIKDYAMWDKVLTDSFGPRKFVKTELTTDELYK